ncbi:hypothetical protein DL93DRAFT_2076923 [Clavulina sp. PMI_390]|nr:hypothetical protein DL93DRAFT_2076923 [Clavulina sp. PMI_390]
MSSPPAYTSSDRPLPVGWVKEYDASSNRFFYVNTEAQPPFSTWDHPFDLAINEKKEETYYEEPQRSYAPPDYPPPAMAAAASSSSPPPAAFAPAPIVVAGPSSSPQRNGPMRLGRIGIVGNVKNYALNRLAGGMSSPAPSPRPAAAYAPPPPPAAIAVAPAPNTYVAVDNGAGAGGRHGGRRGGRHGGRDTVAGLATNAIIGKVL